MGTLGALSGYFRGAQSLFWLTAIREKWGLPEVLPEYLPDVGPVETVDMWIRALKPYFLGMWFLGFACMARVNNASGKRVSCCDRVCLFGTPGIPIFANKNQDLENSRRSLRERVST